MHGHMIRLYPPFGYFANSRTAVEIVADQYNLATTARTTMIVTA
jgi:hypothetical protein